MRGTCASIFLLATLTGCAPAQIKPDPVLACASPAATSLNYDVRWAPTASALPHHQQLRARAGKDLPTTQTAVYVHALAQHHDRVEWSFAASRGPDGLWKVSRVGEQAGGLLAMTPKWLPSGERKLDGVASAAVDQLLANPCFFKEPTFTMDRNTGVGAWHTTVDVRTPGRSYTASGVGRVVGLPGELINLITGD